MTETTAKAPARHRAQPAPMPQPLSIILAFLLINVAFWAVPSPWDIPLLLAGAALCVAMLVQRVRLESWKVDRMVEEALER